MVDMSGSSHRMLSSTTGCGQNAVSRYSRVRSGTYRSLTKAQALGSRDSEDGVERPGVVSRGSAATPLRVLTPLRDASAALANTLQEMATTSGLLASLNSRYESDSDSEIVVRSSPAALKKSMKKIQEPVKEDMEICRQNLVDVVGKRHPMLRAAADQIFSAGGKRLRPLIVLLVARATYPITQLPDVTERHRRLAEITEMIHTASLVHDDVLDECDIRRGKKTVNNVYGSRVAVLVGDFLFAQSSWYLANLDNLEVIKLISQVIADFADGEISQAASLFDLNLSLERYIDKSFYKTASLIAASCRGAAVFSDCDESVKAAMYEYGRHLGLAFQVVDDVLDFTQSTAALGKPQGQDLASGNLTAPVLFALQDNTVGPRLLSLIKTKFQKEENLKEALSLVEAGGGIQKARELARQEGDMALQCLECLPPTPAKESLAAMVELVLERLY